LVEYSRLEVLEKLDNGSVEDVKGVCDGFCKEIQKFLGFLVQVIIRFYSLDQIKFRVVKYSQKDTKEVTYQTLDT
jgi:hypothetical protein